MEKKISVRSLKGQVVLVLGGAGLVGMAVNRELLSRSPKEIHIHSLNLSEAQEAVEKLQPEAGDVKLIPQAGDIFALEDSKGPLDELRAYVSALSDDDLSRFWLYNLIKKIKPDVIIDCINTATAIAYKNIFKSAEKLLDKLEKDEDLKDEAVALLQSLYIPRLIRHIQILYRGMMEVGTYSYIKVGTTGTGGMGLNIPYTHSEEKPSRVLLSKSALAGAHSLLLFLMARTPGAPITKELKPAAAIAWKEIGFGPIYRKGKPITLVDAKPQPLGETFSTRDDSAAKELEDVLKSVYIHTGENGIFSLEEFSVLTTADQMEFVTPEEIARDLVFELEGRNTGHDVINALDNVTIGPSYRAGLMRHWAMEKMNELQQKHDVHSVAFEMLGPPRLSKLLFEAHLLRLAFKNMEAVRQTSAEEITEKLNNLVLENSQVANEIVSVGIPIYLNDGRIIRGKEVILPAEADNTPITKEKLESWIRDGWVDLRFENCQLWKERFEKIHRQLENLPPDDTSSRFLHNHRFWHQENEILPGKLVSWIFMYEEEGWRIK